MSTTGPVRMFRVHVVLREVTGGTLALLLCALVFSTVAAHPMSPWNIAALVSLQGDLKLRVLMSTGLSDKLQTAAGGFLSEAEEQQVRKQTGDDEQMGKLIEILKGKQDKTSSLSWRCCEVPTMECGWMSWRERQKSSKK